MPNVNYYLKPAVGKPPKSLIYLQVRHHGQKFFYSMRFNVSKANWDMKKQEVKERSQTVKLPGGDGSVNCNELLRNMKEVFLHAFNTEMATGIPSNEGLKKHLDAYMFQKTSKASDQEDKPTLYKLIQEFIDRKVGDRKSGKMRKSESTITTYKTSLKHLKDFEKSEKYKVDFDTINLDFQNKYVNYLEKEKKVIATKGKKKGKVIIVPGMSANSVVKEIKNLKTFMNKALSLEYTTNRKFQLKDFSVETVDTDAVYLTEKEIRSLYAFDFTGNKRLEQVRDLFVFSCFTGLRISDARRIGPENKVTIDGEPFIKITAQKTGQPLITPANDIVQNIFSRYQNTPTGMPPVISDQKYNEYVKELCEDAGMKETGRLNSDLSLPLYKAISSHTARRSFATNCYLDGMDDQMIMAVTGHKTQKSFLTYIKVTREENAKRMAAHMRKSLSKKALSIAS